MTDARISLLVRGAGRNGNRGEWRNIPFSASYVLFRSRTTPSSRQCRELILSLDDSDWLGAYALHPHVSWFRPFPGGWESSDEGSYFEFGIEPERSFGKSERPVTISFPIAVGLGQKRYYLGEHFGFFSAGVAVSVPLAFIPSSWGEMESRPKRHLFRLAANAAPIEQRRHAGTKACSRCLGTEF